MTVWDSSGLFLGLGKDLETVFGSTHLVEQLLFSYVPLSLTFDFDLILGSFLNFIWVLMDYFGVGVGLKKCFVSTDVVEQLLFSIVSSILTFDFDLILESFFTFWGPNVQFLGSE